MDSSISKRDALESSFQNAAQPLSVVRRSASKFTTRRGCEVFVAAGGSPAFSSEKTNRRAACSTNSSQPRSVPIVPELHEILSEAYDAAPVGSAEIVSLSTSNLQRNLRLIAERAGLPSLQVGPWQTEAVSRDDVRDDLSSTCSESVDRT